MTSLPVPGHSSTANSSELTSTAPGFSGAIQKSASNIQTFEPYEGKMNENTWTKVASKVNKRRRRDRIIRQNMDIFNAPKIHFTKFFKLTFPRTDIETDLNVIAIDKDIKKKIGNPEKIKRLSKDTLQIEVKTKEQGEKLLTIKEIATENVLIQPHDAMNKIKGTLYSETMSNSSIEELQEALKDQGVEQITRMKRKVGGQLVDTNRYVLTFDRTELPRVIKITDWHREVIDLYIPPPIRCAKCTYFGHLKKWCRKEEVCTRCGDTGHTVISCNNAPFCIHCQGDHNTMTRDCPVFRFKAEVIATHARQRIPVREAEELVRERYQAEGKTYSFVTRRNLKEASQPTAPLPYVSTAENLSQGPQPKPNTNVPIKTSGNKSTELNPTDQSSESSEMTSIAPPLPVSPHLPKTQSDIISEKPKEQRITTKKSPVLEQRTVKVPTRNQSICSSEPKNQTHLSSQNKPTETQNKSDKISSVSEKERTKEKEEASALSKCENKKSKSGIDGNKADKLPPDSQRRYSLTSSLPSFTIPPPPPPRLHHPPTTGRGKDDHKRRRSESDTLSPTITRAKKPSSDPDSHSHQIPVLSSGSNANAKISNRTWKY